MPAIDCACGCGRRASQHHHVVYEQELRRLDPARERGLVKDKRNLVPVSHLCHYSHHNRIAVYPLSMLPDPVFEFAREVLGGPAAYEYLQRRYDGDDPRLDALIEEAA